ncbi:MAG: DUF6356 family protein [Candidatus Kariarchaeaceae archaeon]|jgi:hypothetical protein
MSHLEEVNETYWQHFKCAIGFSGTMLLLAIICTIHAFIPELFKTTASDNIESLLKRMKRCEDSD